MRSSRGAVIVAGLAAALAMSGSGDATRQLVHTGAGVARREAYHGRRAQERAELEEVNVEEVLKPVIRNAICVSRYVFK